MLKNRKLLRDKLINLKVNSPEARELQKKADRYAKGNISKWLRRAGKEYAPKKNVA